MTLLSCSWSHYLSLNTLINICPEYEDVEGLMKKTTDPNLSKSNMLRVLVSSLRSVRGNHSRQCQPRTL